MRPYTVSRPNRWSTKKDERKGNFVPGGAKPPEGHYRTAEAARKLGRSVSQLKRDSDKLVTLGLLERKTMTCGQHAYRIFSEKDIQMMWNYLNADEIASTNALIGKYAWLMVEKIRELYGWKSVLPDTEGAKLLEVDIDDVKGTASIRINAKFETGQ